MGARTSPAQGTDARERFRPPHLAEGQEPLLLLNPGPINVSQRVAQALLGGDLCHREPSYAALQAETRALLLKAFVPGEEARYAPVLLTGSGTAAVEAMLSSLVAPGRKLLVLQNGVYGERMVKIAQAHGIEVAALEHEWTEPASPERLKEALAADPSVGAVAAVHHETTTGLLNPVRELARVCRDAQVPLLLDGVSALAGETCELAGWGVSAVACTANKCVRGLPGVSFVLAERALLERAAAYPPRSLYLHLPTYAREQDQDGVPFTPAVQITFALREALCELLEDGVEHRVAGMAAAAAQVRQGLEGLGLELLLPPERRSNTITTVLLPAGWTYEALHDALEAKGFVIYAGQGELRRRAFRIANMGLVSLAEYARLIEVLGELIRRGPPAAGGAA